MSKLYNLQLNEISGDFNFTLLNWCLMFVWISSICCFPTMSKSSETTPFYAVVRALQLCQIEACEHSYVELAPGYAEECMAMPCISSTDIRGNCDCNAIPWIDHMQPVRDHMRLDRYINDNL